jgi:AraC family transcriptional regulator, arabinose operon regulatory protein
MHDPAKSYTNTLPVTPSPPPGILVADHFGASYGYHVRRPHGTRDWLLTYTLAGEGRYRIGAQSYSCRSGDLFLLEPGAGHDYATATPAEAWEFYWVHFTPRAHWLQWLRLPQLAPGLLALPIETPALRERLTQAFARLLRDRWGMGAWQEALTANALEEVLIVAAQQQEKRQGRPFDPRIEAVLVLINQRFGERLTIADLAQNVALSPSRLAHLFKAQTGVSVMDLVLDLRLRQAARLLEFSGLTVGEIAHDVGFQSPFHFSRQFKRYFGQSPLAYRRQTQAAAVVDGRT